MKILLVDDEEAILDVFKQALEQAQLEVITALTGTEGMEKTRQEHPDIIFLDQVLPDMNGNQVLQQLKADPDTKSIPIAMLSNFSQDTLVENAMKMGASDYILKYQIAPADLVAKAKALFDETQPKTHEVSLNTGEEAL
ncbi:MAG TPA: response regulator [Candidatus Eisenbacteria bacterium]|nr:response regulator [Candidatus Eisenbacteria bacterium]